MCGFFNSPSINWIASANRRSSSAAFSSGAKRGSDVIGGGDVGFSRASAFRAAGFRAPSEAIKATQPIQSAERAMSLSFDPWVGARLNGRAVERQKNYQRVSRPSPLFDVSRRQMVP